MVVVVSACTNTATTPTTTTSSPTDTGSPASGPIPPNGPATTQNLPPVKLADSRFAPNAYLISGDTLDAAAQQATSGFTIQKTANADGTTTISLSSSNPEYQNQTYTLQPGQKLYFIETALGDDNNNQENNLGDDRALITDADGNIIQMPGRPNGPGGFGSGGLGNMTDAQRAQFNQQMIDACTGKQVNDSCTITPARGNINRICQMRNSTLSCTIPRTGGFGGPPPGQ